MNNAYRWPLSSLMAMYVVLGLILCFQYHSSFTYQERFLFLEIMVLYAWIGGLLLYAKVKFDLYLFEPITIISALYVGIFVVKPIIDLSAHDMYAHGVNVMSGGEKATLLVGVGYTVLYVSYYVSHKRVLYRSRPLLTFDEEDDEADLVLLYASWGIVFVLCIICLLSQGYSFWYIFSFGTEGERILDTESTPLLFLSNFGITLAVLWLMILVRSPSVWIRIVTSALCLVYLLMRNARWLMLVFILSPLVYHYGRQRRSPKMWIVVIVGVAALAVFAWMQVNRAVLHSGGAMQGWGEKGFSLGILLAPLRTDLNTYKTFYGMVNQFPENHAYMLGSTVFYTFIIFVPRVLWPGKPDNPMRSMIEYSLNRSARISGTAVTNIGEMYANFGVFGILGGMYLFGWILAAVKRSFVSPLFEDVPQSEERLLVYSVTFPLLYQWVARGNFAGNFYLMIFAYLPFIGRRILHQIRRAGPAAK